MGTLSYTVTMSLDGYAADSDGDFDWTAPDSDVFDYHVERMSQISTEVLGRRTHLLMQYWEAEPPGESWSPAEHEFARRWQALEHVVASSTLTEDDLGDQRARLVPELSLQRLQEIVTAASGEVEIFGPTTARPAIMAGMVKDFRFFIVPRVVGGGLAALPDGAALSLQLVEHRVFDGGMTLLHYRAAPQAT